MRVLRAHRGEALGFPKQLFTADVMCVVCRIDAGPPKTLKAPALVTLHGAISPRGEDQRDRTE